MSRSEATWSWVRHLALTAVLLPALGCGSAETLPELVPVKGKIAFNGQPLARGSVSLRPASGGWEQPTGPVRDGQYELFTNGRPGAPVGEYTAVVFATDEGPAGAAHPGMPKSIIPLKYNQPGKSPLRVKVSTTPAPNAYDLELRP